jgi:hypothetical protein
MKHAHLNSPLYVALHENFKENVKKFTTRNENIFTLEGESW